MTKGFWLDVELLHDKNTTMQEKLLLIEITNLSMLDKGCIASNTHFAELFKVKKESISRSLSSLEKKGYILTKIKEGSRNHDRTITINKMLSVAITKCLETKENKTSNTQDIDLVNEIIDYLNIKTGKKYSSKSKGNQKPILSRLKEGYKLQDFKNVIDIKYFTWKDNLEMSKYLRPETLFGNKFDSYLNEVMSDSERYVEEVY